MKMTKKLTPLPKLLKKAECVFNKFIRIRDQDKGCISCGGPVDHAGHYFPVGGHSALRFNELNVNGQCVGCNTYKHGNLIYYRQGLVNRYGIFEIETWEEECMSNKLKKWSRTELEEIIKKYTI